MNARIVRTNRSRRLLAAVALLAMVLVACADNGGDPDAEEGEPEATEDGGESGADDQSEVAQEGTVRVAVATFTGDTLDPAMESRSTVLNQLIHMWDYLIEIGPDGELEPGVATSWEVDDSGLNWTFELRDDVVFHDGAPLTAEDVEFSIERFMSEDAESTGASLLRELVEDVEVVDTHTLVVTTQDVAVSLPYAFSPHQNEGGIIFPKDYMLAEAGDDFQAQSELLEEAPIGSGPFQFVERTMGDSMVFEAIESHWRNTPTFERLEILLVPEPATQVAMLRSGEIDIVNITGDQIDEVEDAGLEVRGIEGALGVTLQFVGTYRPAAEGKPTTDPEVRRALSLAINRQEIIDTLLAGEASLPQVPFNVLPATQDIDPDHFADWAEENNRYDPDEARQILADAGYPDGFSGVNMHTFARPGTPYLPQLGEIVAAQWSEIGVDMDIVPTDYGTYREHYVRAPMESDYNAGDASPYSTGPRFDALGTLQTYWQYEDGSVQYIMDDEIDERISQVGSIIDDGEREAFVSEIFDDVNATWISPPLFDQNALYAVNPEVVGDWQVFPGWAYLGRTFETIQHP